MSPSSNIRVKICCISSVKEAQLAIKYGASALGLVSEMPSGPGVIDEELITEIVKTVPPPIATFLLTSKTSAEEIFIQQRKTKVNTLQLVDFVEFEELKKLRHNFPEVKLVQVIHVLDKRSVAEAIAVEPFVDALLLDSGNPNLDVKVLGGTGRKHNWDVSREIREKVNIPLFLAGGLSSGNAVDAIEKVCPFGLDICSGVRTNGKLDEKKVKQFFNEVNKVNVK
jgi:phosphoribosylanthranilate isomerase